MIHVDRTRIPRPKALDSDANPGLRREQANATKFYSRTEYTRGQKRFRFKVYMDRSIRAALNDLFYDKCAYCESKIGLTTPGDIEHFRPKTGVLESPDHPGYWWLASDWDNLLLACTNCNRTTTSKEGKSGKGNRFPLKNEEGRAYRPQDDLREEQMLLLDPCKDEPLDHLVYLDDGTISSITERGQTSILVYGLNRRPLVKARLNAIKTISARIKVIEYATRQLKVSSGKGKARVQDDISRSLSELAEMTKADQEYACLKRQYIRSGLERFGLADNITELRASSRRVTKMEQRKVKKEYESFTRDLENISFSSHGEERQKYLLQEHYVHKMELTNIKIFSHLELDFMSAHSDGAPWLMLLGENGTGKSTVLKSLALNLCDATYIQELVTRRAVDLRSYIRHGCKVGTIKVWISSQAKPRILQIRRDTIKFISPEGTDVVYQLSINQEPSGSEHWQAPSYILGYGATRLLPRSPDDGAALIQSEYGRVGNLFNPFVPLSDAKQWLLGLDKKHFRRAAIILKDLLNMGEEEQLVRTKGQVFAVVNGGKVPLAELSDGYQSVVALISDILQLVMTEWANPDEARGVVLLDEVGAHLHPRWKMRIVGNLRKALPHIQFIATTHQPLCLRGMGDGEVVLMRRDEINDVEAITDLPNPKELKISQILTSVFGLSSTMDPDMEKAYNRYHKLLAMRLRSEEEDEELAQLRNNLKPDLMLGDTLLDVQTYKVVQEQYEKYQQSDKQGDLGQLDEDTMTAVQSLWKKKV